MNILEKCVIPYSLFFFFANTDLNKSATTFDYSLTNLPLKTAPLCTSGLLPAQLLFLDCFLCNFIMNLKLSPSPNIHFCINLTWLWRCPCPTVKFEINGHCFDAVDGAQQTSQTHKSLDQNELSEEWSENSCSTAQRDEPTEGNWPYFNYTDGLSHYKLSMWV